MENIYGLPCLKELRLRIFLVYLEFNCIDLEEEKFVIDQIANTGVTILVE